MAGARAPRVVVLVENLPVPLDRRTWQESLALTHAGWQVTVIGPRGSGTMRRLRDRIDGIEILRYPQRAASGLSGYLLEYIPSMAFTAAWLVWTRVRGGPIQVVHGCNPPDLFWIFGRFARRAGGHYVFDQHDANVELAATKWGGSGIVSRGLLRLTAALERASYRTASLVLAPNDSYRRIAIERGVAPERVVVVRNAPDVVRYRELAAERVEHGADPPAEPPRIGYVGVMGSQDGLDVLLDAWALVVSEADLIDARLELVGDGEARPHLEAQARRLGIAGNVRFHGYQPPEVFVPLLADCVAGVSPDPPTPFNDVSTMVKIVDYVAIGLPVVSFALAESRLVAGDAGVEVEPADAHALAATLVALLRDPSRVRGLASRTAERVAALDLDWEHSAARLVEAYRALA